MNVSRRSLLQSLAVGSAVAAAGCGGLGITGTTATPSVTDITTNYHGFGTHEILSGELIESSQTSPNTSGEAVTARELDPKSRLEAINAITRTALISDTGFHLGANQTFDPIRYRGSAFSLSLMIADSWAVPDHGPRHDPNWHDPVRVDATMEGDELTLTLRNELDVNLPVHHYGRPYFGVLSAVGETTQPLHHDQYEENEYIQTEPVIRVVTEYDYIQSRDDMGESLQPGGTLEETYRLPPNLPDRSKVFFSMPIGDSSIEMLRGGSAIGSNPRLHATITLESDSATPRE